MIRITRLVNFISGLRNSSGFQGVSKELRRLAAKKGGEMELVPKQEVVERLTLTDQILVKI